MEIQILHFETSGGAYDAAMSDDTIQKGDVLVVESEGVVGLADTWPVAVTLEAGQLHHVRDDLTLEGYGFDPESVDKAEHVAARYGFPLNTTGANNE